MSKNKKLYGLDFTHAGLEAVALAILYGVISTKHTMNPNWGDVVVLTGTDSGGRKYVTVFEITETIKGPDIDHIFIPIVGWETSKMIYGKVLLNPKGQQITKLPSDCTFKVHPGGVIGTDFHSGLYAIHTGRLFNA